MVHGVLVSIEMRCMSDHSLFPILFLFGIPGGIPSPQGGERRGSRLLLPFYSPRPPKTTAAALLPLFFARSTLTPLSPRLFMRRGEREEPPPPPPPDRQTRQADVYNKNGGGNTTDATFAFCLGASGWR